MCHRAAALALCCLLPALPGCLIVVDHSDEVHWVRDDGTPGRPIGVYLDSVDHALAAQLGIEPGHAALITSIVPGSASERAGLQRYDIITTVDGDPTASPARVRRAIREHKSGENLCLTVLRQGKPVEITVPVAK